MGNLVSTGLAALIMIPRLSVAISTRRPHHQISGGNVMSRPKRRHRRLRIRHKRGGREKPPPPILSDTNQRKIGEQSPLGPASPVMATTEPSPLPRERNKLNKASPAQSLLSRSGPPPQSPAYLAPQYQVSSTTTSLRSVHSTFCCCY